MLFFVLQLQFAIKGSNAIPGNVQSGKGAGGTGNSENGNVSIELATGTQDTNGIEYPVQFDLPTNEIHENAENENDPKDDDEEEDVVEDNDPQDEEDVVNESETKEDETTKVPSVQSRPVSLSKIPSREYSHFELVMPRATKQTSTSFGDLVSNPHSPDSDRMANFMLRSSQPLRPKTVSRQSAANSDDFSTDWIDINSEISGSSRIAKMIYSSSHLEGEQGLPSITFDFLCEFLEANLEKIMCEDELLLICKRIVLERETLLKALKDLPLFIKNHGQDHNASCIYNILFSYLGHSEESFKELLLNVDKENGSESSRCSSRESNFSIETTATNSAANSQTNSPHPNAKSSSFEEEGRVAEGKSVDTEMADTEISELPDKFPIYSNTKLFGKQYIVRPGMGFHHAGGYMHLPFGHLIVKDFPRREQRVKTTPIPEQSGNGDIIEEID